MSHDQFVLVPTPPADLQPKPPAGKPTPASLLVVESVYYQGSNEQPTGTRTQFQRFLETDEQPYERQTKVGEDWIPLDTGWISSACSQLLLRNIEGMGMVATPTIEEAEAIKAKVLEVTWAHIAQTDERNADGCVFIVPPGESMRVAPADAARLCIRCRKGEARFRIFLLPG